MRKSIFYISILIVFFTSCTKSIYFAYNKDTTYCTIEVTGKDEILYRGNYSTFIFLESVNFSSINKKDNTGYISFVAPGWLTYKVKGDNLFNLCPSNNMEQITYKLVSEDSIELICQSCVDSILLSDPCFLNNGIDWFPPFMKKVEKIDYEKFGLPNIKKKYLMNPDKAPIVSDRKE